MSTANALVTGRVDTTTTFSGTLLLDDGRELVAAIEHGDWISGGFAAFSGAIDTVAAVSDPLGSLIAAGLGWLMDHLEPLNGWLNDLTGDPGEVEGFARTWSNIGTQMRSSASELGRIASDLDSAEGETINAYLRFQQDVVDHLNGAATWANGMSSGMQMASTIVQVVHDMVRDTLAQLVGSIISWTAELALTVGLATPTVIEQVTTRVADLAAKFAKKIPELVDAIKRLAKLLEKLQALFQRFSEAADRGLKRHHSAWNSRAHGADSARPTYRDSHQLSPPLSPEKITEITSLPHGLRPDPSEYLEKSYIDNHLKKFKGGATRFVSKSVHEKYGLPQRDGTTFVMPRQEIASLFEETAGDPSKIETALGLAPGSLSSAEIQRIDIEYPDQFGLRMPSGNESGATGEWIPGGYLPTGIPEAVIDAANLKQGAQYWLSSDLRNGTHDASE